MAAPRRILRGAAGFLGACGAVRDDELFRGGLRRFWAREGESGNITALKSNERNFTSLLSPRGGSVAGGARSGAGYAPKTSPSFLAAGTEKNRHTSENSVSAVPNRM